MGILDFLVDTWREASDEVDAEYRSKNVLTPGCVIRDDRDTYDHYGIYSGDGYVIHFTEGVIQETTIEEMKGRRWGYLDVMAFDSEHTEGISLADSLARARSCLGMTGYDLLNNNCEHFALWCRTGKALSTQAFGSRSDAYSALCASFFNIPRRISELYSHEVGMEVSRTVDLEWLNDGDN